MQPQGRKKLSFPGKENINFKDSQTKNWWEDIVTLSKKRDRQLAKKEIREYKDKQ